jgi:hypothetical protein
MRAKAALDRLTYRLDQPGISEWVTGKFVIETVTDEDQNTRLQVTVELASDRSGNADLVTDSIRTQLLRLNSRYAHYVPAEYQPPQVIIRPAGDPDYFPIVKHRYTR